MRQWRSLVPSLHHLHAAAPPCFPQPPSPSPCPSPPRDQQEDEAEAEHQHQHQHQQPPPPPPPVVRLVGCDGRVRSYAPPVTARELMQQHPRHLVCRADALLIGERIPAVGAAEELQPGQAYFLLPAHLFRSVLSFVSLASSLLLLLSTTAAAGAGAGSKGSAAAGGKPRPFELLRTPAGALRIKFDDDFLLPDKDKPPRAPLLLGGDDRLAKDYEELVGYGKSRRWAPKLDTIEEVVAAPPPPAARPAAAGKSGGRKSRALPFLGRLGSRRRRGDACSPAAAVACSG
ncbi:hypothetical protein BS78_05G158300 [Paspalum vaginatum]|nr:hypothetical protein BS78_05G158300 [Paspalum vaginatum]